MYTCVYIHFHMQKANDVYACVCLYVDACACESARETGRKREIDCVALLQVCSAKGHWYTYIYIYI